MLGVNMFWFFLVISALSAPIERFIVSCIYRPLFITTKKWLNLVYLYLSFSHKYFFLKERHFFPYFGSFQDAKQYCLGNSYLYLGQGNWRSHWTIQGEMWEITNYQVARTDLKVRLCFLDVAVFSGCFGLWSLWQPSTHQFYQASFSLLCEYIKCHAVIVFNNMYKSLFKGSLC